MLGDPPKAGPLGAPSAAGSRAAGPELAPVPDVAHVRSGRILGRYVTRIPVKAVDAIYPATTERYDPNDGGKPFSRMVDDEVRSFWRFGLTEKFSNAGETRTLHALIGRAHPFMVEDVVFYNRSFEPIFGDAYRLLPISLLEGPRVWYGQLSDERRQRHNEWIENVGHIQGVVLSDENWRGAHFELRDLPVDYNRTGGHLPRMSVMVKNLPELPEWELNNMMMTVFGMMQPGNPLTLRGL